MAETLLQKAQRLGIQPAGQNPVQPIQNETLLQKAQRLGIKPQAEIKEPTFGGHVVRGLIKPFVKVATSAKNLGQIATGQPQTDIQSKYLGNVERVGKGFDVTSFSPKSVKGAISAAGTGLELASNIPLVKGVGLGLGGLKTLAKGGAKQFVKQSTLPLAREGATQGFLGTTGQELQTGEAPSLGRIAGGTALGGVLGPVLGTALPIVGGLTRSIPRTASKVASKFTPEAIMNRVARLDPNKAIEFKRLSGGKSHGEYLKETGNFQNPDAIVETETKKWIDSKQSVDDEFAKLPGIYQDKNIDYALNELLDRESRIGIPTEETARVQQLVNKNQQGGLDMSEINEVKRLLERNGIEYRKERLSDKAEKVKRIDTGLREWQLKQADTLGFENLRDLNKQTQLSRFLADALGKKLAKQMGNEAINLTDWVILSGGDPTAVAGFFAKRFFGNKGVQSSIAGALSKTKPTGMIEPKIGPSKVPLLPSGKTNVPSSQVNVPINLRGEFTQESQSPRIFNQENLRFQKQLPPPSGKPVGGKEPSAIPIAPKGSFELISKKGIGDFIPKKQTPQQLLQKESEKAYTDIIPQSKKKAVSQFTKKTTNNTKISAKTINLLKRWMYTPDRVFKRFYKSGNPIFSNDVIEQLSQYKPQKPVKLYRGLTGKQTLNSNSPTSWTYDKEVAKDHTYGEGKVVSRIFKPDEIIVDFGELSRDIQEKIGVIGDEEEVIVHVLKKRKLPLTPNKK